MNFQTTSNVSYFRTYSNIGVRQQLQHRRSLYLPGGLVLWKAVGKAMLLLLPLMFLVHMFLASIIADVEQSLSSVDNQRHELVDKNIGLLAKRAYLYAPERVGQLAGERLSLYTASPDQIERIN
jgi:hypothetical protein